MPCTAHCCPTSSGANSARSVGESSSALDYEFEPKVAVKISIHLSLRVNLRYGPGSSHRVGQLHVGTIVPALWQNLIKLRDRGRQKHMPDSIYKL